LTFGPLSCWGIWAEDEHGDCGCGNEDKRDDEGNSPCDMSGQVLLADEGVKNRRHDEISNPTARVAPSSRERVRSTDNILIEKAGRPDLARDERATENTDEKSKNVKTSSVVNGACESGWQGTEEETGGEGNFGSETIACRSRNKTNEKAAGLLAICTKEWVDRGKLTWQ